MGIILTGFGVYLNYGDIVNNEFPDTIMVLALGLNNLMVAYLSSHLFPKDERSKDIMGKGMLINYYVLFGAIFVLFLLTGSLGPITLDSTQVLIVLFCIMSLTIPGPMVIYSQLL